MRFVRAPSGWIGNLQWHDFSANPLPVDDQPSHADRQLEPPRPRASGIEVKHAVTRLLLGHVAVPINHRLESRSLRLEIELRKIVQHVNGNPADLDHFRLPQLASPCCLIHVAANGGHGSNRCKLIENSRIAHIAAVNDLLRSAQCFEGFRPQQTMRIRDDADEDGSSQLRLISEFISAWDGEPSIVLYVPCAFSSAASRRSRPNVARIGPDPRLIRFTPSAASSRTEGEPGTARTLTGQLRSVTILRIVSASR